MGDLIEVDFLAKRKININKVPDKAEKPKVPFNNMGVEERLKAIEEIIINHHGILAQLLSSKLKK